MWVDDNGVCSAYMSVGRWRWILGQYLFPTYFGARLKGPADESQIYQYCVLGGYFAVLVYIENLMFHRAGRLSARALEIASSEGFQYMFAWRRSFVSTANESFTTGGIKSYCNCWW